MKVYESTISNKRGFIKVPQIKIKNSQLIKIGFVIGSEYKIIYESGRIILQLIENDVNLKGGNHEPNQERKNQNSNETAI